MEETWANWAKLMLGLTLPLSLSLSLSLSLTHTHTLHYITCSLCFLSETLSMNPSLSDNYFLKWFLLLMPMKRERVRMWEGEWTSGGRRDGVGWGGGHSTTSVGFNPPSGRRQDQLDIRKPLWTWFTCRDTLGGHAWLLFENGKYNLRLKLR